MPAKLFADTGYDADWIHGFRRDVWGVPSWINSVTGHRDGRLGAIADGIDSAQAQEGS